MSIVKIFVLRKGGFYRIIENEGDYFYYLSFEINIGNFLDEIVYGEKVFVVLKG